MLYQIHVVWFLGVSIYSNAYMYWEGNTETNNVQKKSIVTWHLYDAVIPS